MVQFPRVGGTPVQDNPPNAANGKQWVDTSQSPPEVKVYDSATGTWLPADTTATVVSQTRPTPEVGKIWFEPAQDGTNMYAASSNFWKFLKFIPAVPDSQDLLGRYDAREITASDGDGLTSWADASDAGNDLSGGTPTYKTNQIGGQPVVRFDGIDDFLDVTYGTSYGTPNTICFLIRLQSLDTTAFESVFSDDTNSGTHRFQQPNSDDWRMVNPDPLKGGSPDTNAHIFSALYAGTGSETRDNGTQIISGDAGTNSLGGFGLGAEADANHINVDVLEVLVYDGDKSSIYSDIESYLDRDTNLI